MIFWSEMLCISAIPQASNCQSWTVWQSGSCQNPSQTSVLRQKEQILKAALSDIASFQQAKNNQFRNSG